MNDKKLTDSIENLSRLIDVQAQVISIAIDQLVKVRASLETSRSTQRAILKKMGIPENEIKVREEAAYAAALKIAQHENEIALATVEKISGISDQNQGSN